MNALPMVGKDKSFKEVTGYVYKVVSFDMHDSTVDSSNKVTRNDALGPYGFLGVQNHLGEAETFPLFHRDDFILAQSFFEIPSAEDWLRDAELLVVYRPQHKLPLGLGGVKHTMHYVMVPRNTHARWHSQAEVFKSSPYKLEQLFTEFKYKGEIAVRQNMNPSFE